MSTKGRLTEILITLLCITGFIVGPAQPPLRTLREAPEAPGRLGLVLMKEEGLPPRVIGFDSNSLANISVHLGDYIIGAGTNSDLSNAESFVNAKLQRIVDSLEGPVGSFVTLKMQRRLGDTNSQYMTRLERVAVNSNNSIISTGFFHLRSDFQLTHSSGDDLSSIPGGFSVGGTSNAVVQPSYEMWRRITNGTSLGQLLTLLGPPLQLTPQARKEVPAVYTYGWICFDQLVFPEALWFRVYVQGDRVVAKEDPFLGNLSSNNLPTSPVPLMPSDAHTFSHYPRFLDLRWAPSSGDYPMRYIVEVGIEIGEKWDTNITNTIICYHCVAFAGMNRGRWRVKAINGLGESGWSEYRYFRFRQ